MNIFGAETVAGILIKACPMKPFFASGEWHSYGEMEEVNTSSVSPELLQSLVCSRLLKNLPLEQLHRKTIFKKTLK